MGYDIDLKNQIDILNKKRNTLFNELKIIDNEITKLEKQYHTNKIKCNFDKGICSCCYDKLMEDDIKYEIIYCETCRDNDSVLDYHGNCHI